MQAVAEWWPVLAGLSLLFLLVKEWGAAAPVKYRWAQAVGAKAAPAPRGGLCRPEALGPDRVPRRTGVRGHGPWPFFDRQRS